MSSNGYANCYEPSNTDGQVEFPSGMDNFGMLTYTCHQPTYSGQESSGTDRFGNAVYEDKDNKWKNS